MKIIVAVLLFALHAHAGHVRIYVVKDQVASCAPAAQPEHSIFVLNVDQATEALGNYFHGRKNPRLYDAGFVNAGMNFCGDPERQAVFSYVVRALDTAKPSKRVYEVIRNYRASEIMREEIDRELARPGISKAYRRNLGKAKRKL